jgi:hypothetical protein
MSGAVGLANLGRMTKLANLGRMTKPRPNPELTQNPTTGEEDPATPEDVTAVKTPILKATRSAQTNEGQQIRPKTEERSNLVRNNP